MKTVNMGRPILSSDYQIKLSSAAQKQQSPLKLFTQSEKTHTQCFKLYNTIFKFPVFSSIFFSFTLDSRGLLAHQRRSKRVFSEGEKTSCNQSTLAVVCLGWFKGSSTSFPGLFPQKLEKSPGNEVGVK